LGACGGGWVCGCVCVWVADFRDSDRSDCLFIGTYLCNLPSLVFLSCSFGLSHIHSQLSNAKLEDTPFTARRTDPPARRLLPVQTLAISPSVCQLLCNNTLCDNTSTTNRKSTWTSLQPGKMADPHNLVHRATTWEDPTELQKIMDEMSTLSLSRRFPSLPRSRKPFSSSASMTISPRSVTFMLLVHTQQTTPYSYTSSRRLNIISRT
jgi:hypothetical protein